MGKANPGLEVFKGQVHDATKDDSTIRLHFKLSQPQLRRLETRAQILHLWLFHLGELVSDGGGNTPTLGHELAPSLTHTGKVDSHIQLF